MITIEEELRNRIAHLERQLEERQQQLNLVNDRLFAARRVIFNATMALAGAEMKEPS